MTADRLCSLALFLAALGFIFVILPRGAATLDYGTMTPATMPRLLGMIIATLALVQLFLPATRPDLLPTFGEALRAGAMLTLAVSGALLIPVIGFLPVSIGLALSASLLMGERNPMWLGIGGLVLPLTVWAGVTQLLDRNLP